MQGQKPTKLSLLIITFFVLIFISGCSGENDRLWQGYIEGNFVYVAAPLGGRLDEIEVQKGRHVEAGTPLFTLEREFEKAGVQEASENLDKALSTLADKRKGRRPSEIASIRARLEKATAARDLARTEYRRRVDLYDTRTISEEELDKARTDYEQASHQVRQISSELKTATLGSRSDEIKAAESEVKAARAKLEQARWNYDHKSQSAPRSGLVFDIIRYRGEWVPAGRPVLSILPPENRKVRFYVPETIVGSFSPGEKLLLNYDGLQKPVEVTVSYVSPQAEYTPPVIYSSQSRAKLVFMLEAVPARDKAHLLKPGQPVDVARKASDFSSDKGFLARLFSGELPLF